MERENDAASDAGLASPDSAQQLKSQHASTPTDLVNSTVKSDLKFLGFVIAWIVNAIVALIALIRDEYTQPLTTLTWVISALIVFAYGWSGIQRDHE